MDKPIAQRLRESESLDMCDFAKEFAASTNCEGVTCSEHWKAALNAIADEIEREQEKIIETQCGNSFLLKDIAHKAIKVWALKNNMPMKDDETISEWLDRWTVMRPHYEDGEPIPWDGEFVAHDGNVEYMNNFRVNAAGDYSINSLAPCPGKVICHGESVKRPTSKVYDANGVECVKDEKVWCTTTGEPCKIIEINPKTNMCAVEWIDCDLFDSWLRADCITHREQDSLEKLKADRKLTFSEYVAKYKDAISMTDHLIDRAIALAERGA